MDPLDNLQKASTMVEADLKDENDLTGVLERVLCGPVDDEVLAAFVMIVLSVEGMAGRFGRVEDQIAVALRWLLLGKRLGLTQAERESLPK